MRLDEHTYLMRQALFSPAESKVDLSRWIRVFLGIDFPDCIVSEESNSSPMDYIWEVYDQARKGDDEAFSRVMAYAGRGCAKTLSATVLELLVILHLRRNVGHMAALKMQSGFAQAYLRGFFGRPWLRDFRVGQNADTIECCRYYNEDTGENLTEKEWKGVSCEEQNWYQCIQNSIKIVPCTMAGTNGLHVSFFCVDEIDVIAPQHKPAYDQARHILSSRDGFLPITILTSTRKSSYGLIQKELDQAHKTGLVVRHWNTIDYTSACPIRRHRPDLPKEEVWINDATLDVLSQDDYGLLDEASQSQFKQSVVFGGCAKCVGVSICKSRLATHQKSTSSMLMPIGELLPKLKSTPVDQIQTEMMCRKPDTSGLIYPRLEREVHLKTAAEIAEMVTGDKFVTIDKATLLTLLRERGAKFFAGIDFGFSDAFAVALGAVWGEFCFIVTAFEIPGLELDDKIAFCEPLKEFQPWIYGDPEAPSDIKTFSRKGFLMRKWSKGPGSVKAGIEIVRFKLRNMLGNATLFFLKDPGCESAVEKMRKYHFTTDEAGQIFNEPEKTDDHICDAVRYLVMNVFSKGRVNSDPVFEEEVATSIIQQDQELKLPPEIAEIIGQNLGDETLEAGVEDSSGRIIFSFV